MQPQSAVPDTDRTLGAFSPYIIFSREQWADLRNTTPMPLTADDVRALQGLNEDLSMQEVEAIYLPLARLLNLYVVAVQNLYQVTDHFLGKPAAKVPYVIGVAGSVAVGKSTTARLLQALLSRWTEHRRVDLVTTDGFLYPNRVLQERGIMHRKGFPESYDLRRLVQFVSDVKSGREHVTAPIYSHLSYDIIPDAVQVVDRPDIMIIEGLNVLQHATDNGNRASQVFVSDFFDFSIYVDADEAQIEQWYVHRFLKLRETAFKKPESYFRNYSSLSEAEAIQTAMHIWDSINGLNLRENIAPTRERAHLILKKGPEHAVQEVWLRKL
jgi:type I pantothenate kinase